jgi:hypothetical protein
MKTFRLKYPVAAVLLCALGSTPLLIAQDDGSNGPPKVLVINREYTKPGKTGSAHERAESAFIVAAKANKAPFHYLGMTSMTGPDRSLFFSAYPSFTAWADESKAMDKLPALGPALDRAMLADGDLLSETDTTVWTRDDEKSLNPGNLVGMRYMEITVFRIKPGHGAEWDEAVKMVKDAYKKGVPEANWSMFQEYFGTPGNGYIVIVPLKSVGDIDGRIASGPKFAAAMGKDGMKKLDALVASCVEEEQTNLFHFDPKMSIPWPEWVAAEPDFWAPKHAAPPATKPAAPEKK